MSENNIIAEFKGKNHFLSNFYKCDFVYNGLTYHNAEAAFQFSGRLGSFLPMRLAATGFVTSVYLILSSSVAHFWAWKAASALW